LYLLPGLHGAVVFPILTPVDQAAVLRMHIPVLPLFRTESPPDVQKGPEVLQTSLVLIE